MSSSFFALYDYLQVFLHFFLSFADSGLPLPRLVPHGASLPHTSAAFPHALVAGVYCDAF